ncbi:hypothetical protein KJ845_04070 [Patescibacteria group bacterium]|nr:hypothetical protein [Patescibacteria group bacterium]
MSRKHLLFLFILVLPVASLFIPKQLDSAALTSASITLSNSRLSYYAKIGVGNTNPGDTTFTIQGSSNADNDTNHLFPNDTINIGSNANSTVGTIIDSTNFAIATGITNQLVVGDAVYATQSGTVTIAFTINNDIPANGYIRVSIPSIATNGNDGAPDTAATTAANGWDLHSIVAADVTVSGGTGCSWNATEVITAAGAGTSHKIDATTTAACTAGTITMTIDSSPGLINPAPVTSGHTQGTADAYQWTIATYDGNPAATGKKIDSVDVSVAPIEAVLVSATIDETLSFSITAVTADSGTTGSCGITRTASSPDSTAYSIPWGTISSTYLAATHNTSQLLQVSTNADGGYAVTAIANDQMGKDGIACTGDVGEAVNCIKDTACGAVVCTHETLKDWGADPASYPGLGYSLEEVTAAEASFEYDDTTATYNAKQFADEEDSQAAQTIMTNAAPVDASQVYVCYRIDVTATQPAGYYFNKVRYTATAIF